MRLRHAILIVPALLACSKARPTPSAAIAGDAESIVTVGVPVELDGSGSKEAGRFEWALVLKPGASEATLGTPTASRSWIVPDVEGLYVISLAVNDGTLASERVTVRLIARCGRPYQVAIDTPAGPLRVGEAIALSATVFHPDAACAAGAPDVTGLSWSILEQPAGSLARVVEPGDTAPVLTPDKPGRYRIVLEVTDAERRVGRGERALDVEVCGSSAPIVESMLAEPAQPAVGSAVRITAVVSDPDNVPPCGMGQMLARAWRFRDLPRGSSAVLAPSDGDAPQFVPDVPGRYVIELEARDSSGRTGTREISVDVVACGRNAPSVALVEALPASSTTGAAVGLRASVSDADTGASCGLADTHTLSWRVAALPAGSEAQLAQAQADEPWFVTDRPGSYRIEVIATDATGLASAPASVEIQASSCGDGRPSVTVSGTSGGVWAPVQLAGVATDPDSAAPCSQPVDVTWRWWVETLPAGAHVHITGGDGARPWFIPDRPGVYRVRAVVTDRTGRASPVAGASIDVAACGGARPIASASATPSTADVGEVVTVAASVSDADSQSPCFEAVRLSHRWWFEELPAGSQARLDDATLRAPSFIADLSGTYQLRVVATDETGLASPPAAVAVSVQSCGGAAPTVAPSALPAGPVVGTVVGLDAAAADDDDLAPCGRSSAFTYHWWLEAIPVGSAARLNSPSLSAPSFAPDVPGSYVAAVMATDETGRASDVGRVEIAVADCGAAAPTVAPSAVPAATATAQRVDLSAGGDDADTGATCGLTTRLTYHWSFEERPAASQTQLTSASLAAPSFTPDVPGDYVLRVVATDDTGRASAPRTVTVTASGCGANPPTAAPSAPASPLTGDVVQVSANAADADTGAACGLSGTLTYRWWFEELPAGSAATLDDPSLESPAFTADLPGAYRLRLEVRDPGGRSSGVTSMVVSVDPCGSNAPFVSALRGVPATPPVGASVQLLADVADADTSACGLSQTVALQWRMLSAPTGSQSLLDGSAAPRFTPDRAGNYVFEVTATDSTGRDSAPQTLTIAADPCGTNAPTASAAAAPTTALLGQGVTLTGTLTDVDNGPVCAALGVSAQALVARWSLVQAPPGSQISLPSNGSRITTFAPDVRGTYVAELVAEDSTGRVSAPSRVTITAAPCGDNRPLAFLQETSPEIVPDTCVNAVQDLDVGTVSGCTAALPPPFQFDAGCSFDADNGLACAPMNQSLQYEWIVLQQPVASLAQIQPSSDGRNAWFQIDLPGDYKIGMRVTDGLSWSEWSTVHLAQAVLGPPTRTFPSGNNAINSFQPSVRTNSDGSAIVAFRPDRNPDGSFDPQIRVGRCGANCNLAASWTYAAVDCAANTGPSVNRYRDDPLAYEMSYVRGAELFFARCSAADDRCFNRPGPLCIEAPLLSLTKVDVNGATVGGAQLTTTLAQARASGFPGSDNLWIAYLTSAATPGLAFCPGGGASCNAAGGWCTGSIAAQTLNTSVIDGQHFVGLHAFPDGAGADVLVAAFRNSANNGDLVFRTCRNTVNTCPGATCLNPLNWSALTVDAGGFGVDVGNFPSIWRTACDAPRQQGRIHIGYTSETAGTYKYATCLPTAACPSTTGCLIAANWSVVTIGPSPVGGGVPSTSMHVSPRDGLARIAAHHHDGTFGLRLFTNRLTAGAFDPNNFRVTDAVCGNAGHEPSLWVHTDGSVRVGHSQGFGPPYEFYFYEP